MSVLVESACAQHQDFSQRAKRGEVRLEAREGDIMA